jgi:ABC-type transporter Mla MlaB component
MVRLGLTRLGSLWWIQVSGRLGIEDLRRLAVLSGRLGSQKSSRVLLDFSRVRHLDYRGIHRLLAAARLIRLRGGEMRLTGVTPYLWDLLCLGVAQDAEELAGPRPSGGGRLRAQRGEGALVAGVLGETASACARPSKN